MINITPLTKTQKFIEKAKLIHGNRYDYSLVEYKKWNYKINIICKIHGIFKQSPSDHLSGCGCKICSHNFKSFDLFIQNSNKKHKFKYNYDRVKYINSKIKVEIICEEHGPFYQSPSDHIQGQGCPKCAGLYKTNDEIIKQFNKIHKNKYDYSLVDYKGYSCKINIKCYIHGIFEQKTSDHIKGNGCPVCRSSKGELIVKEYLENNNIRYEKEKRFINCKNIKPLPFDFYLPEHNMVIEFHGEQHYKLNMFFYDVKGFEGMVMRDRIKKDYCLENNIGYIELNKKNLKHIDKIIKNKINE